MACHTSESECLLRLKNRELRFLFLLFFFLAVASGSDGFRNNPTMKLLFLLLFLVSLARDFESAFGPTIKSVFTSGIRLSASVACFDDETDADGGLWSPIDGDMCVVSAKYML